jgi:hypothetical protein
MERWMQEALIGQRHAAAKRMLAFGKRSATLALAASLFGGWAGQVKAETLRWKLNPGEVLHYAMESKEVLNAQLQGRDKKSTRTTTTNLSWTVKSVSANGDAEILLRFDRVRMRVDAPPIVPLEFDSNPNKLEIPEEFEAIDRQIKASAGVELTFTLRSNGEIDDLKVPEQTLKKLREGIPKDTPDADSVSEKGIKEMLLSSKPPVFPSGPIEAGKNWASKPAKVPVPFGSLSIDQVFTFLGPDPKTPRLLVVGVETRVTLEPAENVTAKIRKQEGTGSLTFDSETGRIVNTRNKHKVEMIITHQGQDMIQSTDTTRTMTLEP